MAVPDTDEDEFLTPEAEDASQKSSHDITSQKKALKNSTPEELVKSGAQPECEELKSDVILIFFSDFILWLECK